MTNRGHVRALLSNEVGFLDRPWTKWRFSPRGGAPACLLLLLLSGCAIIYPESQTPTRAPLEGQEVEPAPSDDLYFLYIEGASIPPQTPGGLDWPGGAPDPFAKLIVNEVELFHTPTQSKTREPTWPNQKKANYRLPPHSKVYVEVWDDNPMTNKPICRVAVREIEGLREGGNNELWCDSGARVRIHVEPARALIGLGLYYETRGSDGVRVTRVISDSPAARKGLGPGDRILSINGKDTKTMNGNEVRSAINMSAKKGVQLDVWFQDGKRHLITLKEGAVYPLPDDDLELPESKE